MTTVTQRLAFLISANADQAIKAFDKTANSAEKQLGKASKSIDKLGMSMTKFGAAGLAAAGTLGAGLAKLAQNAIDDQKSQALLADQLKKSTGATNEQIKSVEKFIDSTARQTGVIDDMLRPALQTLVRATGDVGKAQSLLKLSMDVSAGSGRDLSSVVTAMSRAAIGNFSALTRLGIPIDENTKKSKDFSKVVDLLSSKFGGAAAVAADTYAGRMARAKVAIGEAGEQLGAAFIPYVQEGATVLAGAVNGLAKFDQATGGVVSKLAAFGTVGLGVVSAGSLMAGQMIKLRDRFAAVDAETGAFTGKLTPMGKAVTGVAVAAGVATAVYAMYAEQKRKVAQATSDFADALNAEKSAQGDAIKNFILNNKYGSDVIKVMSTLGVTFDDVNKSAHGQSKTMDSLNAAMQVFLKSNSNAGEASAYLSEKLGHNVKLTQQQFFALSVLLTIYGNYKQQVEDTAAATELANNATDKHTKRINDLTAAFTSNYNWAQMRNRYVDRAAVAAKEAADKEAKAAEEQTKAQQKATKAAEDFKNKVLEQAQALQTNLNSALQQATARLTDATNGYKNFQSAVSGAVTGTLNLGAAQTQASDNAKAIADAQKNVYDTYTKLGEAYASGDESKVADARKELTAATEALDAALKKPIDFMAVFRNQEEAAKTFAGNVQKLMDLGANKATIDQLVAAGADTGNQIASSILNGADPKGKVDEINRIVDSTQKIADDLGTNAADKYFKNGVTLAQNLVNGINSVMSKAEIKLTWKALNKDGKPMKNLNNLTDLFQSQITGMFTTAGVAAGEVPKLADGGVVKARSGGTLALLGEGGRDEMVLPLPSSGALGGTTINVTVSAGMGSDGTQIGKQIVDELVAYQRRVGALPIKVVS